MSDSLDADHPPINSDLEANERDLTPSETTGEHHGKHGRALVAGLVGNILEWYDFAVYGFFAVTIGHLFFPSEDKTLSLIAAFGSFAAGFLMRPVGAVIFGYIGDLVGRKQTLMLSILMMAIPTFLIGLMPTYEQIGPLAGAFLVLLRMVQGVSVGGEYTGSIVFLVEHAPPGRRGFFGSFSVLGAVGGTLLGSAVVGFLNVALTESELYSWGWRLPFLSGVLLGVVGLAVRRGIPEIPLAPRKEASPLVEAFSSHRKPMLQAAGLNMMSAVTFYTMFVYITVWLVNQSHETEAEALEINTLSMIFLAIMIPIGALVSDRVGRKPILVVSSLGVLLFSYPFLWLMHHHNFTLILLGQMGFAFFIALFVGVVPVTISELFPRGVRVSASSVSYNLPFALFGGTAPMVATELVKMTGDAMSISWYLMAVAMISCVVALTIPETNTPTLVENSA